MPISRKFIWAYSDEFGVYGWRPADMPEFDPVNSGFGMAHDVLEHFSATDSSIEAEFMAFGSILYLRAETDYWSMIGRMNPDPANQLYDEIHRFIWHDTIEQSRSIRDAGRTRELHTEVEDILWHIKAKIKDQTDADEWNEFADELLHRAFDWMRRGYRKATRRWQLDECERLDLFYRVERHCDELCAKRYFDEGTLLTISVNKQTMEVNHRVKYPN